MKSVLSVIAFWMVLLSLAAGTGYFWGYGSGMAEGYHKGHTYTMKEVELSLREGLATGQNFFLGSDERVISDIELMPRRDGNIAFREVPK